MSYAIEIYADVAGRTYGASETDQRYTQAATRTVGGEPVAYAGRWYGSQMGYRPFKEAVAHAAKRLAGRGA